MMSPEFQFGDVPEKRQVVLVLYLIFEKLNLHSIQVEIIIPTVSITNHG